jgi:hypothetical protein
LIFACEYDDVDTTDAMMLDRATTLESMAASS